MGHLTVLRAPASHVREFDSRSGRFLFTVAFFSVQAAALPGAVHIWVGVSEPKGSNSMKVTKCAFATLAPMAVLTALFIAAPFHEALAQVAPPLGTTQSFAVLGGASVVNTGSTVIVGDVGVSPGTVISGFPPGTETGGTTHQTDAVAGQAQSDNTAAYLNLAGQKPTTDLTGTDLGGLTLVAGVYSFSSSAQLTGPLTLDAGGNSAAVWVFQIGSTLTTASGSSVVLINGAAPCNVLLAGWQLRDAQFNHHLRRKCFRAHKHYPHYGRNRRRQAPGAEWLSDAGYQYSLHLRVRRDDGLSRATHAQQGL